MEKQTLLHITTEQCRLTLRGIPERPEQNVSVEIRCGNPVSAAADGREIPVCDDILRGIPLAGVRKLQVAAEANLPVAVSPALDDLVRNDAGTFCTGYLDLAETAEETVLTVTADGKACLQLAWNTAPTLTDCAAALTEETRSMLRELAVRQIHKMDPDFLPDGCAEDALRQSLEESYRKLLELADGILSDLEKQTGLRLLKRRTAYDTPENRLVRHVLRTSARCLSDLDLDDEKIGALNRRANLELFTHVGSYCAAEETRPDAMAPVYQLLHQTYRRLCAAAALLQMQEACPPAQRYRVWAFLKLSVLLQKRYDLVSQTVLQIREDGIALPAWDDALVCMDFSCAEQTTAVRLTMLQDEQILLQKKDGAAYRFDVCCHMTAHGPYLEELKAAYHRRNELFYRKRGGTVGAFLLFPGADTPDYRQSEAYTAINRENLGGIPLRPGEDTLLQRLLDKLLIGIPMLDFEPVSLPTELEMELERVDWSRRNVLVGVLRRAEQLELCLRRHFYHIPAHLVKPDAHPIGYVALYQSRNLFGRDAGIRYYGEVAEYNAVPRYTIKESPSYSKETYYRFAIKKWHTLPQTIQVRADGSLAKLTNLFLLQNCSTDTGLLIANEEMFRLQYALQQAVNTYGAGDGDPETGFALADCQVAVYHGKICVFREGNACGEVPLTLWQKKPQQALMQIYGYIFHEKDDKP